MEKQEAQEQGETLTNKEDSNNDGQQLKDNIQNDEIYNKQKSEQSSSPQMISNINDSEYKRELYKIYNEESNNVSEYTQDQIKKIDSHILKNISNEDNQEQFKKQISNDEENIGQQDENQQNQNNRHNQEQSEDSKQDKELQGKISEQNTLKQNQYSNNIIGLNKQESLDISPIKPPSTQKNQKNLNMNMNLIKNCSGEPDESSTPQQIMQQLKSQLSQEGTINQKFLDNFTYSQSNENRLSEKRDSETQQIEQSQGNKMQNISEFSKLKQKSQSSKSDQNNSNKKSQSIEESQNLTKKKSYSNENKNKFPGDSLKEEKYRNKKDKQESKIENQQINDSQEIENQLQEDKLSESDQQVLELKGENEQKDTLQFTKSNQISKNKIKDQKNLPNQKQAPDFDKHNTFEQNEYSEQNQKEQESENGDQTEKLQIQIKTDNENQQQQEEQIKLKLDENQNQHENENEKANKNYYINQDEEEQKNEYNYENQENDDEFEKISIKNKKKSQWTIGNITNNIALLISQDFQYLYIPICFLPDDLNQGDEIKLEAFKINQSKQNQQLQDLTQLQNQILNDPGFFGEQV